MKKIVVIGSTNTDMVVKAERIPRPGATPVAALWGILVWKEFKGAPKIAHAFNRAMVILFVAGLGVIIKAGA